MIGLHAHTNPFPYGMVVVAGNMGLQLLAVDQLKRVEKLRAPKRLAQHARLDRRAVIVHDVVRPQQHIAFPIVVIGGQRAIGQIFQRS